MTHSPASIRRPYIVRHLEDEYAISDVVGNVTRKHPDFASLSEREAALFRRCIELTATEIFVQNFRDYVTSQPDPTGVAVRVIGFAWDHFERDVTRSVKESVGA